MHVMSKWEPSLDRYLEVEKGMGQIEDQQGRLKSHLSFWEQKLEPAPWIISCIRDGYKLSVWVINLWYLNRFLWQDNFKYEDLCIAMLMFQKGDYLFSFDFISQWYLWALQTVSKLQTKLLRPLVKYWHSQGLQALTMVWWRVQARKQQSRLAGK